MNRLILLVLKILLPVFSIVVFAQQTTSSIVEYGPVKENETLWSIATNFTGEGASVTATTQQIFKNNPGAFENGNIHRLKKGAVLKITTAVVSQAEVSNPPATDTSPTMSAGGVKIASPPLQIPSAPVAEIVAATVAINEDKAQTNLPQVGAASSVSEGPVVSPEEAGNAVGSAQPVAPASDAVDMTPEVSQQAPVQQSHDHDEFRIRYSYDVAFVNDDNIRRSRWAEDIREDNILDLSFNARGSLKLSRYSNLSVGAQLGAEKYSTFDLLDNFRYALKLKYSFAFASGFLSPVYAIKLDIGGIQSESDIRTSDTASIGLEMNKWLSDAVILTLGYKYKQSEASTRVFDTEENQLFVNLDLELSNRNVIYMTYHYISGDIVSSATPRLSIINIAEVIEPDDAFGGLTTNQFAYRLDADSQLFTVGFNSALTRSLSYDLSVRFIDSEATQNADIFYERLIIRAGLLGRF